MIVLVFQAEWIEIILIFFHCTSNIDLFLNHLVINFLNDVEFDVI